jgi:hypothetical protein
VNRLLNHVEARYPDVWGYYAHILADPSGLPEWPNWHSFWSGPKAGKRELAVRWLPTIPVKIEGDAPVTIRKIDS